MNEFSPEQPQAARQFSSSCAESHPATLKSWGLPDGTPTRDAETSEAQQEESGLSIEPTPAESRQSTMPTQATHCIASGESDAEAPAGLHTNKQAGSHDCELVVAPTGQGSTASCEAKADRALPVTIITRKETNTMSNETIDSLTPGEDGVQEQNSCPETTPTGSNTVAASCDQSPVIDGNIESTTPGFASGEPDAKAPAAQPPNEHVVSHDCELTQEPDSEPSLPASCEAKADGTSLPITNQTIQPRKESNTMCNNTPDNLTPGEDGVQEQNSCPETTPMGSTPVATPCDHTPVIDGNIESTTPSAAALASANLNSGTDFVATTNTNTVMNTTSNTTATVQTDDASAVTIVNPADFIPADKVMILASGAALPEPSVLGDKCAAYCVFDERLKDIATDTTAMSLKYVASFDNNTPGFRAVNMASTAVDTADKYDLYVYVEQPGMQYFGVEADDSARLVIPSLGVDITKPTGSLNIAKGQGNAPQAGFYRIAELSYTNILYGSANAVALKVSHDTSAIVDGNYSGGNTYSRTFSPSPDMKFFVLLKGAVPSKVAHAPNPCGCSSEGSGSASCSCASWDMAFGQFPMMAGMPSASVGFFSDKLAAADLSPANLRVNHPMLNELIVEGEKVTVKPQFGETVRYSLTTGKPLDNAALSTARVRKLDADFAANTENEAAYIEEAFSDGSSLIYPIAGGTPVRMVTSEDVAFSADEFHTAYEVIRDDSDVIRQIYAASTGVLTVTSYGSSAFMLNLYPLSQVGSKGENGYYAVSGTSVKSVAISGVADSVLNVIESTPDGMPTRYRWDKNGNVWTFTKGDETINEQQTRTEDALSPAAWTGDNTYTDADGNTIEAEHTQYRHTNFGQVVDKIISGSGDEAQVTQYIYGEIAGRNDYGRVIRVLHPNGSHTRYEYDAEGREVLNVSTTVVAGYVEKGTRTTYASGRYNENRPATVKTVLVNEAGNETVLATTSYAYVDTADVHRVTTTRTAAGSSLSMVSIEERFGTSATLPYARGRIKFSQSENGVQTWHSYEATELHGAVVKHTAETRAEDVAVNGQSRRKVKFIAANGTVLRQEEHVLISAGEWVLISSESYTYDHLMRELTCTRGNGRTSSKAWMCCGLASETDEDGVTTLYNYDAAKRLIGKERSATETTPATVTVYNLDAAGRTIGTMTSTGDMVTTTASEFDLQGRIVAQTDVLGRISRTVYSADGLTTTQITPAGATLITTNNVDGSTARVYGTGQRELVYGYDLNGSNLRTTLRNSAGNIVSQTITNGFGQTIVQAEPNTLGGFIYTRREYNVKGLLVKQYQDTGWNTAKTAATLYEYDSFGNKLKQVLALSDTPTKDNSPVREMAYSVESAEDGVYSVTTQTRYNAAGEPLSATQKQLISQLSATLASKSISIDVRGNSSVNWSEYTAPMKVTSFSAIPTSNITAESISIDGFTISQKNHVGIVTSATRSFTASGMTLVQVDGRGNATTTAMDQAGRTISVTDAAGAITSTVYDIIHDQPSVITDAMGNTSCYKYDHRGRKIAEWGTALQPACFGYDDMDNMITLRTFRADGENISTDPSERSDYDETTWAFNAATGLEMFKTYADDTSVAKNYDAYNRLVTETDARGNVKTHSYEHARGLHLGTTYTVVEGTAATEDRSFTYNHLGLMIQTVDEAGTRSFGYNAYGERATDSLVVDGDTHLITETRDSFGRSSGYIYAKNGTVQQTVSTSYGDDGRISSAGFLHGGEAKNFGYTYLAGTHLLQVLTKPNGMTLTQTYEANRNLTTGIAYHRGSSLVAQRTYTYDLLGRPTVRNTSRQGNVTNDTFAHNSRSELVEALVNGKDYEYTFDNMGNRQTSIEDNYAVLYDTNELNQYSAVSENDSAAFEPQFDANGNQTAIKTDTGIWEAVYNAENRPVRFMNEESNIVVECTYDSMGRRATKKLTINGSVTKHERYLYRGYLQIACCDLARTSHPCLWLITWDPTQPIFSRPLAIQKNATWYTYGVDISKNICELFGSNGYIVTSYAYTPFGRVTAFGNVEQPIQWSSEFFDNELKLVYYIHRYYSPVIGRWLSIDPMAEFYNLYVYCANKAHAIDFLGLLTQQERNRAKVANTITVGVSLEWWDDDGGPGGQAGTLSIGQQDDLLVSTGTSARAVCNCGKFDVIDGSIWVDSGTEEFWWGSVTYRTGVQTSEDLEDAGVFVFRSELDAEGDGGMLTNIILAAIAGATAPFASGIIVAAVTLASDIAMKIAQRIASNDTNKWLTTAVLSCEDKESLYSKPKVTWGPIVPKNIGIRETTRFNGVGYEHYVPKVERIEN